MHAEFARFMPCNMKVFLGNFNVKSRLYENTFKIFPNRHQRPIPYLWTHCSIWVCLQKNNQRNMWNKTGIHYIILSAYFSHGSTWLLSNALHNWNLGTQDQKKIASMWMILE